MKKLFYLVIVTFAFVFAGPMMASADRVHIPIVYHYGSTSSSVDNWTAIFVKNLTSEAMKVTIHFDASTNLKFIRGTDALSGTTTTTSGSTVTTTTSGLASTTHSGKTITTTIPARGTWNVRTDDTNVWGSTTNQYEAKVTVESSGVDDPYVEGVTYTGTGIDGTGKGPIAVAAAFVSAQSAGPSGFVLPTYYRVRSWASTDRGPDDSQSGLTQSANYTVDNWGQ